jgi:hypothetical protein
MRFWRRRWPRMAMILVCGCAFGSLCVLQYKSWPTCAPPGRSDGEQTAARYEPLAALLPTAGVTRFVVDERHVAPGGLPPTGRLFMAQYAVSPRRLANDVESRWAVVDSDCPTSVSPIAAAGHWTLCADLHNGVKLYRTDVKE